MTNILTKTEPRNEDDVIYVENYIKKYFAQGLVEIKSKVDQEQFKKVCDFTIFYIKTIKIRIFLNIYIYILAAVFNEI